MISRQVQKLSRPEGPRASDSPAMARWKVWLWRLEMAGSSTATQVSSACAAAPVSISAIRPSAPISRRTFSDQPEGRRPVAAWMDFMLANICTRAPLTHYVYT